MKFVAVGFFAHSFNFIGGARARDTGLLPY
jgi:hypothetical protein